MQIMKNSVIAQREREKEGQGVEDEGNRVGGEETAFAGDGEVLMIGECPKGECWSLTQALLLHLADDVSRDGWVEVDGVVT